MVLLSSSLAGILNSLTPIFTLLAGIIIFNTNVRKQQYVGIVIGFAGSITLSFVGSGGSLGSFNYFALFIIVATILYGISTNMIKVYFSKINPAVLTSLAIFSVTPLAVIYLLSSDFIFRLSNTEGAWISLGYLFLLGAVGTAFALILFNKLIQITSAVLASTVTYLIPVTAVVWGIIDGEELYILHFVGMILIITGVFVINKFR